MTNSDPSWSSSEEHFEPSAVTGAIGHEAAAGARQVAGVTTDEATKVAAEAKTRVKDLYHQTRCELTAQARAQQERVASGLHSLSDELTSMAENSEGSGVAADLVGQTASRVGGVAQWLGNRDPGSLLDEVKDFARHRPGTFVALAAATGVLVGRFTRSLASESSGTTRKAPTDSPSGSVEHTPSALADGIPTAGSHSVATPEGRQSATSSAPRAHVAEPTMAGAAFVTTESATAFSGLTGYSRADLVDAEGTDVETTGYDPRDDLRNEFGAELDPAANGAEVGQRQTTGLDGQVSAGTSR